MAEPTLAEVVKRLEAVEKQLAEQDAAKQLRKKDWRRVIGNSADNEFALLMQAEIEAEREADRCAAQRGASRVILLDTNHVTLLRMAQSARRDYLVARLTGAAEERVCIPVVTVEEQMRGWLAAIAKERRPIRQVGPYRELAALFDFFADYEIVPFDEAAVAIFDQFNRIRIGARDRKIAAIALANNALLLTANRRDFEQIPACGSRTGWTRLRPRSWRNEPDAGVHRRHLRRDPRETGSAGPARRCR